jgi:hypothetical protein
MKSTAILCFFVIVSLQGFSQFCYDSLCIKKQFPASGPSIKFISYANDFFKFSKKNHLSSIDTICKGSITAKNMVEKLDKGFGVKYFSKGAMVYSINSNCMLGEENVNFGLLEICYSSIKDAKAAYGIFSKKKYFRHYDKILRIYRPLLNSSRLLIFHTATPEDDSLRSFFASIGINDFILEK